MMHSILSDHNKSPTRKLNLGCGKDIRPPSEGWINCDSIASAGVMQLDIFSLPLPFENNSFDLVLAKHILEHVPHQLPGYGNERNFLQSLIEDIWRVLKVGGILRVEGPRGLRTLLDNIDHKRIVTPGTFHIFFKNDPWNYYSDCRFELITAIPKPNLGYKIVRTLLRACQIDVEPLRVMPEAFELRKLPAP